MKLGLIITAAILGLGVFFGISTYVTYNKIGVDSDAGVKAQYIENQNVFSAYTTKVMEAASIPEMARDDLRAVIEGALKARNGADGARATFNFVQENYPGQVDSKLYQKLQDIIDAGRTDFKREQTKLIDKKRVYEQQLNYLWSGFWLRLQGFPKVPLDTYNVVIDDNVTEKFRTGKDAPIVLRPKAPVPATN